MGEDAPKQENSSSYLDSSYEGIVSTAFVALANLLTAPTIRVIASIIAAPLGVAVGKLIGWRIKQFNRNNIRKSIDEEMDDLRKDLALPDLTPERREKLYDGLDRLRRIRLKHLLLSDE